ncbi:hypothetical protein HMPREF9555_01447 [Selenomonas artemidis F0399]|uniref:Uncharacterized protein n=1 Tax=Selenomonas artemidis F0399 TaxID=749551 RepID=E7N373_9FIRM|nr:hypothetical protein HMPREF9555_01447 [Selenomonas artemidis F0399]
MAHSCVTAKNTAVDVGFIYAFLAFSSLPSYASKLPRHLCCGMTGGAACDLGA